MFVPTNTNNPRVLFGSSSFIPENFPPQPPPCDCPESSKQYRTLVEQKYGLRAYQECASRSKATEIAANLARQIEKDREYISTQLVFKGIGMVKKWKGKSSKARELLLRKVNPTMHDKNWNKGHFGYQFRYGSYPQEMRKDQEKYRNICLLPYINLESLKEDPSRFPSLMYNRTKYPPEDWVSFDSRMLNVSWTAGCVDLKFNQSCIVMHGAKYGEVVA
jgi:hypothetical protein